ncbi:MAG TPA: methionyl-tRNA formyltransferase, partial [Longimicrobiales bacterium]|nr:methionyl-tRNA formyltransferase [Longimicrobiales bacterium]
RGEEFLARVAALEPDLSVVVAYGHILTDEVLSLPPKGSINVHASLLPELRGAAPITWAIARGHTRTGITIIRMVREMDAGPILHQVEEPILPDETASELALRLSELGAEALVEALALLASGRAREVEQDHAATTYAPKVRREDARIDWTRSARDVALHVRAMDETPGAWTLLGGEPVKLFRPSLVDLAQDAAPGTIVGTDGGLVVRAGEGWVRFGEAQAAGGRRMSASAWVNGRRIEPGLRFE